MEEKRMPVGKDKSSSPRTKSSAISSARRHQKISAAPSKEVAPKQTTGEKARRELSIKVPRVGPMAAASPNAKLSRPSISESVVESSESLVESSESLVELSEPVDDGIKLRDPLRDPPKNTIELPRLPRAPASTLNVGRQRNAFRPGPASPLTDRPSKASATGPNASLNRTIPVTEAVPIAKKTKSGGFFKFPKSPRFLNFNALSFGFVKKDKKNDDDNVKRETPQALLDKELARLSREVLHEVLTAKIDWKTVMVKSDAKTRALLMAVRNALWASASKGVRSENVDVLYALLDYEGHKKNKAADRVAVFEQMARAFRQPAKEGAGQINLPGKTWGLLLGPDPEPEVLKLGIEPFLQALLDETNPAKRKKLESKLDTFVATIGVDLKIMLIDIWAEFEESVRSYLR